MVDRIEIKKCCAICHWFNPLDYGLCDFNIFNASTMNYVLHACERFELNESIHADKE